jgi:hypothetical protein
MFKKLSIIQAELKVSKTQWNKFGEYHYRSCEDILEALKPLLLAHELFLNISDEIVLIGERYYVKSTATLSDGTKEIKTSAFAREPEKPKAKTDESQQTGATSTYARKYALNGLFCIDDAKDADATNKHEAGQDKETTTDEDFNNLNAPDREIDKAEKEMLKKHIGSTEFNKLMFKHNQKVTISIFKELMKGQAA